MNWLNRKPYRELESLLERESKAINEAKNKFFLMVQLLWQALSLRQHITIVNYKIV